MPHDGNTVKRYQDAVGRQSQASGTHAKPPFAVQGKWLRAQRKVHDTLGLLSSVRHEHVLMQNRDHARGRMDWRFVGLRGIYVEPCNSVLISHLDALCRAYREWGNDPRQLSRASSPRELVTSAV